MAVQDSCLRQQHVLQLVHCDSRRRDQSLLRLRLNGIERLGHIMT